MCVSIGRKVRSASSSQYPPVLVVASVVGAGDPNIRSELGSDYPCELSRPRFSVVSVAGMPLDVHLKDS